MSDRVFRTVEEAIEMMPDRDIVNVQLNPAPGLLIGADWSRGEVIAAMKEGTMLEESGPFASGSGFGLTFVAADGRRLFVETRN